MSLSAQQIAAREAARRHNGHFGVQHHSAPTGFVDEYAVDDWVDSVDQAAQEPACDYPSVAAREMHEAVAEAIEALATKRYREAEPLVTAAGQKVAVRAEELAGITSEQVKAASDEETAVYRQQLDEYAPRLRQEVHDLSMRISERTNEYLAYRQSGVSEQEAEQFRNQVYLATEQWRLRRQEVTVELADVVREANRGLRQEDSELLAENLQRLSDGYQQALGELRDMSGEISNFTKTSQTRARDAFREASSVFPKDWVDASEAAGAMMARQQKTRAHYSHQGGRKRRIPYSLAHGSVTVELPVGQEPESLIHQHPNPVTRSGQLLVHQEDRDGKSVWRNAPMEFPSGDGRYRRWTARGDLPRPRGRDWQWYVDPLDDSQGCWARVATYETVDPNAQVAEIKTSTGPKQLAGASPTLATSVHEFAHRCEYVVSDVAQLEQAWLQRRWEEAGVQDDRPKRLFPGVRGNREVGRDAGFVNAYVGKIYPPRSMGVSSSEVMSIGTESLFGGGYGGLIGTRNTKEDLDHRAFVLGVLATCGRKP